MTGAAAPDAPTPRPSQPPAQPPGATPEEVSPADVASPGGPHLAGATPVRPLVAGAPLDERPPRWVHGPLTREARWGWGSSVAGLATGFGPEVALYAAAIAAGTSAAAGQAVTTGSAIALVISSLLLYGWQTLAAWFFSMRVAGRGLAAWGFRRPTKAFFWTIPVGLVTVYVVSFVHDLIVHPHQQDIIGEFPHTTAGVVLFVLLAVIMAPLFEEVFFRGFLFRGFAASWGWVAGAVVSATVFGLAHLQPDVFVPLFVLGLMLAWVYQRTGSLWTSISLHALFNGISVLAWALTR